MKKILMAALLFGSVISGFAQSKGDVRFGVTGGMNVANVTDNSSDCRIGFNLGGRVEYGITNNVYLGSGLLLTQKGYQYDSDEGDVKGNPLYLEIPIQLGYSFDMGNDIAIFGETGPYLGFGIAGKNKVSSDFGLGSGSTEVKTDYFGDDAANVFDMGWGLRFGVEVSQFQIHMGYEYGFTKVADHTSSHNSNFNVGVSYFF